MGKTILTNPQQKVLQFLSRDPLFTRNFYLTGGTALAEYYLRHRYSEDLDFFTEKEIDKLWLTILVRKIHRTIKSDKLDIQESFNRNLVYFTIKKLILKTEFTYYPFSQIEKGEIMDGIRIDSVIDIAVNKFFTIYQKPTSRHFIDLYLLIKKKKIKWENLTKLARMKFDTVIDPLQLGSQLITVTKMKDIPRMGINLPEDEWRNYFLERVKELKRQIQK